MVGLGYVVQIATHIEATAEHARPLLLVRYESKGSQFACFVHLL